MLGNIETMRNIYDNTLLGCAWFSWYDFPAYDSVLLAGDVCSMACQETKRIFARVYYYNDYPFDDDIKFSAVLVFGGYDYAENKILLNRLKKHLLNNSVLLWAVDNKLGTRFLCGDKHLGNEGEYFTLSKWKKLFLDVNIVLNQVYYVMPDWHTAQRIYASSVSSVDEQCLKYVDPKNMTSHESELLNDVIENGIFTQTANAFLFEYRCDNIRENILKIMLSPTKGRRYSSAILLYVDKAVKKALYHGGSVKNIYDNNIEICTRGINIVPQKYIKENIVMPYIDAPLASKVMVETAAHSIDKFHDMLDTFWQCILLSSNRGNKTELINKNIPMKNLLRKAYIDMVPTNAFYIQGEYVFFDQEYVYDNYPAEYVMFRALMILYGREKSLEQKIPLNEVKKWFGLENLWPTFLEIEEKYLQPRLLRYDVYGKYYDNIIVNSYIIKNNNCIKNISDLYEENLFHDVEGKKIILFGAGEYFNRYLTKYGSEHPPAYIVDNDKKKWHTYKCGVKILSPQYLQQENASDLRVIICSSYIDDMEKDLQRMGIYDYRVF